MLRKYIIFFILIFYTSCNEEELLTQTPHFECPENVFNTVEGALTGLNGIYDILQLQDAVERFEVAGDYCSPDFTYSGEPGGGDSPYEMNLRRFQAYSANPGIYYYWIAIFKGIYRCNTLKMVLEDTENLINFNETIRKQLLSEVYFLRALFEFKLLIVYGGMPQLQQDFSEELMGLPFYDHVPAAHEYYPTRPSLASSWKRIEDDFLEATKWLPLNSAIENSDLGRASKGAAQGMLAKVYLYQEKWQDAYDMAEQVISSGEYWLEGGEGHEGPYFVNRTSKEGIVKVAMPGYKWIFQPEANNCHESVFAVQHRADHSGIFPEGQEGALRPMFYGPRCVWTWDKEQKEYTETQQFWGTYQTTKYFVATAYKDIGCASETNIILDPRYKLSIIDSTDSVPYHYQDEKIRNEFPDSVLYNAWYQWPGTGLSTWKYFSDPIFTMERTSLGDYPNNTYCLRYADVLLIAAEAAIHLQNNDKAIEYTNMVRTRARNCGSTGFPKNLTAITLNDVWAERRVELCFEGQAFFDLVRTRRIKQVLDEATTNYGTATHPYLNMNMQCQFGDNFQKGKNEIFPIPISEIELSQGNLKQNPGY